MTGTNKKAGCGTFLLLIGCIILVWGAIYITQVRERNAYLKCITEAQSRDPFYDKDDSFGQSTVTRSGDTITVLFSTYENGPGVVFVSDMECVVKYQADTWKLTSLHQVDSHRRQP